jgi:hypothetical protein
MNQDEYKKLTTKTALGRKVIALLPIATGIREGDVLTIVAKKDGFTLQGAACSLCGVAPVAAHVAPLLVQLVPEEEK